MSSTLNPAIHESRTPHDPNAEKDGDLGHFVSDSPQEPKPQPSPRVVDTDSLRHTDSSRHTGIGRTLSFSSDEGDNETVDPGTKEKNLCEGFNCSIQGGKKRRRKSRKQRKKKKRRKTRRKRRTRKRKYRGGKRKTKRKN